MALPLPGGPDPDPARQQKFDRLALAMPGFGGKSVEVRFGSSSLSFAASTEGSTATVTHGLGRTPVAITCTPFNAPAAGNRPTISLGSVGATTFLAGGEVKTAFTGSVSFYWIAIG